jgi:hypothetical protein
MYDQQKATVGNNQMAVISAVLAAVAWIIGGIGSCLTALFLPPISICTGVIFLGAGLAAVITGYMGRSQIKESDGAEGGEGLAMLGLIGGGIALVLALLGLCLIILSVAGLALMGPDIGNVFSDIVRELGTPQP